MGERYESVINLSKIAASGAEWAEQSATNVYQQSFASGVATLKHVERKRLANKIMEAATVDIDVLIADRQSDLPNTSQWRYLIACSEKGLTAETGWAVN